MIGGGPAGAAAALTLAKLGVRTAVLESKARPVWKIGETLAPESRQVLQSLGVWEAFLENGHRPSWGASSAWGSEELAEKELIFNPHGSAWQLDRARFESLLQEKAIGAGAEIQRGAAVSSLRRDGEQWEIHTETGRMRARWLIDASGRASVVARHLGLRRLALDQLVSIYTVASAEGDEDSRTLVEAGASGWWYSALMPGGRRTIAWQTDADLLAGEDWRETAWLSRQIEAAHHLRSLLEHHRYSFPDRPRLTSAQSARIEPASGSFWIAVGDAAQSFDPLSGQGLFHALASGHRAAKELVEASPNGGSLRAYAGWLEQTWNRFVSGRKTFYQAERRWPDEPFWRRRQG